MRGRGESPTLMFDNGLLKSGDSVCLVRFYRAAISLSQRLERICSPPRRERRQPALPRTVDASDYNWSRKQSK